MGRVLADGEPAEASAREAWKVRSHLEMMVGEEVKVVVTKLYFDMTKFSKVDTR